MQPKKKVNCLTNEIQEECKLAMTWSDSDNHSDMSLLFGTWTKLSRNYNFKIIIPGLIYTIWEVK